MPRSKTGSKKSKRVPCGKRYKIEKRVRQHNKKLKKQKEAKLKKGSKKHKDPGVPNNCPFKEEILREAQKRRDLKEEERQKRKEKRKKDKDKLLSKHRNMDALVKDVEKKTAIYEQKSKFISENSSKITTKNVESSLKAYYKEVKYVIDSSDVVIEVLDSRDPLGSRCRQLEEAVISSSTNKKLVLLLNKIDLVPKENVEKWLKYLRNEFPTIPFKACTQNQSNKLGRSHVPILSATDDHRKSSSCLGADLLMALLGNYCRNLDIKTSITIGIVGFPNTGKSSIINSLKRSRACNVGSTPGITRSSQVVQLDKHIKLLDSPGVVMATNVASEEDLILKNCVKLESLVDPIPTVSAILGRCNKQQMMMLYSLPDYKDVDEFIQLIAKRYGLLKKGGRLDTIKAAKIVIKDWNGGKITYYTEPPEQYNPSNHVSAEIITEMSKAFDIDQLMREAEEGVMQGLQKPKSSFDTILSTNQLSDGDVLGLRSVSDDKMVYDDDEDDEDGDGDDDDDDGGAIEDDDDDDEEEEDKKNVSNTGMVKVNIQKSKSKNRSSNDVIAVTSRLLPGNLKLNKERKKAFKNARRLKKKADKLADTLESALTTEDYDFKEHF